MKTRDIILQLRQGLNLSQNEFADKLSITRQAVSRWETGETSPNIKALMLIADTFHLTVDYLLGYPPRPCQSCGMLMQQGNNEMVEKVGASSEEYCAFCFQNGAFSQDITLEEMIEHNLQNLEEWNKSTGSRRVE